MKQTKKQNKLTMTFLSKMAIVLLMLLPINARSQTPDNDNIWDYLMHDVKIRYVYALNFNAYLPRPRFGSEIKKRSEQPIIIKGFFLPVDVTNSISVLSYYPMNMCFFCTGTGIETVIELHVKQGEERKFNRLKTDNYIEVKGALELNEKDFTRLIYILNDVELVRIIK
jgi:hypothetical protein